MMTVLKNKNVLLVEDNDEFAQNFMTLLSLFVGAIFHCKDIGSAQKVLVDEKIDMIICDIKLGDENGLDFIESIRSLQGALKKARAEGNRLEEQQILAATARILQLHT